MQKRKFVALTISATVLLSPPSVFGRQPKLTSYQNRAADEMIKALENSEPSEDTQVKSLIEMEISTPKPVYKIGEPIVVNIFLKNISESTELYTPHGACTFIGYGTKILDSHHHKVPYIRSRFAVEAVCSARGLIPLYSNDKPFIDRLTITEFFLLNRADTYTFRMWEPGITSQKDGNTNFDVKSNSIEVKVVNK